MAKVDVTLPDRVDSEIDRLVESGEFLNREQAVEELLSLGLSSYDTTSESASEMDENLFSQAVDEQQDPAIQDDHQDDGRMF
jgi:Arc/MetJ-type ribon-helix-helix transcriptional regulator